MEAPSLSPLKNTKGKILKAANRIPPPTLGQTLKNGSAYVSEDSESKKFFLFIFEKNLEKFFDFFFHFFFLLVIFLWV